jgi:transcriptional regulator with XRE-family HTH domain
VNSNTSEIAQIARSLGEKAYRDAFVAQEIATILPYQIREMRSARGLTQAQLGELTGMKQETISRLENPNDARLTIRTLLRIASGLDVALLVRFVPFSTLVEWTVASHRQLSPESFTSDLQLLVQSTPKETSVIDTHGGAALTLASFGQTPLDDKQLSYLSNPIESREASSDERIAEIRLAPATK